jgi:hypothetical protein
MSFSNHYSVCVTDCTVEGAINTFNNDALTHKFARVCFPSCCILLCSEIRLMLYKTYIFWEWNLCSSCTVLTMYFTTEVHIHSQASPWGMCGAKKWPWNRLFSKYYGFPMSLFSKTVPYSLIHSSSTLYKLSGWHSCMQHLKNLHVSIHVCSYWLLSVL